MNGTRTFILICLAGMAIFCGCEAKTRYQVLSIFFEGVPEPESAAKSAGGAPDATKDKSGATPAERRSLHGPYAAKLCEACHQQGTNRLLMPKEELCLNCHVFQPVRRRHGPIASGGCLVCHDPHRSSHSYLLVSGAKEFCTYCHDPKEIYSHEVHRGSDSACTECHNPHGSDNDFLLR